MQRQLWEIYVPSHWNRGAEIPVEWHEAWDAKVREISGGLTLLHPVKGQWLFNGGCIHEEVIPCRVLATRRELDKILAITLEHYPDQHSILAYRVSDEVVLRYRHEDRSTAAGEEPDGNG